MVAAIFLDHTVSLTRTEWPAHVVNPGASHGANTEVSVQKEACPTCGLHVLILE